VAVVIEFPGAHRARIQALALEELVQRLVRMAYRWGGSEATAEDLASIALVALSRPPQEPPPPQWDYAGDPTAWIFTIQRMEDSWSAEKKRRKRRRTDLDTEAVEEAPPSSDRGPLRLVLAHEEALLAREKVLSRLANAPLALEVAQLCMAEYGMTPRKIAKLKGWDVERVYEAMRKIREVLEDLLAAKKAAREGPRASP
jgi:DNA-directed RNA polymerase specialized sigma24 family protein